ncbi:hypothetical protein LSH36_652g01051 [Paralvinella palmiformis]|uniref:Uncharacterized protein n=1 Tax=Paralvinella palmiformis TaxID=53620 RepID=A0AAD9J363_9ANNE|nr:hypothetical protein LSH36_652g01051 [Paralvinella palmiformis]
MKGDNGTNNSIYGDFTRYDNPDWRRTYITNLPTVRKNKMMDTERRRFKTSGEEYGHFWRENSAGKLTNRSRLAYGTANPAKILYTDPKKDEDTAEASPRKVFLQKTDEELLTHAEAQRNRRNRDKTWAEPRRNSVQSKVNSLPAIEKKNKYLTGSRTPRSRNKTPYRSSTPMERRKGETGIRLAGKISEKLRLPDINRIDLDLYTPDGEVVSITAVPVYVNTFDRK